MEAALCTNFFKQSKQRLILMAAYDLIATAYIVVGLALLIYLFVAHKKKRHRANHKGNSN